MMNVLGHWLEADEKPRCQHCPALADERSFMCENHAGEADEEVQTLRDQLAGAVERVIELEGAITAACAMRGHPTEDARETLFDALGTPAGG